jgi:hypothetical protein
VGRLVLLLGLVFALAACGGSETTTVTAAGGTETVTVTATVTATASSEPAPTISPVEAALHSQTFQMPSKNIGCAQTEDVLVCDILSGLKPEPKRSCELDWTGMEMERLGPAQPRCAGDTAYDQSAPVLHYGKAWGRGDFTCVSMTNGLECHNEDGRGFLLSRDKWAQF